MISLEAQQERGAGPSSGQRVPFDFNDDGDPIWAESKGSDELAKTMRRVYEQSGDFLQVSRASVENGSAFKGKDKAGDGAEGAQDVGALSMDQMVQLRIDMQNRLNDIDYALNSGLNLLNVMLAPLDPSAVDASALPLPPGAIAPVTYSIEHTPVQPDSTALVEGSVSLLSKQKALKDASQALIDAGRQIDQQVTAAAAEWATLLRLREEGWKVRPSGARPGTTRASLVGKGSERAAREVGIAYGPVEAAHTLRVTSLASLSLDDDAATTQKLILPSRPRRRLRVKISMPDGIDHSCGISPPDGDDPLENDLRNAREEAFEEEVFAEVAKEARSMSHDRRTLVTDDAVIVQELEHDATLTVEMVPADSAAAADGSPFARLVSSALRIFLTSNYSTRRSPGVQRPILGPTLDLLQYRLASEALLEALEAAAKLVRAAGIEAVVESDCCVHTAETLVAMMGDPTKKVDVGGTATLRIADRHPIHFLLSAPSTVSICLARGPLALPPQRLRLALDDEICHRVAVEIAMLVRVREGEVVKGGRDHVLVRRGERAWRFGVAIHADAGLSITAVTLDRGSDRTTTHALVSGETLAGWLSNILV